MVETFSSIGDSIPALEVMAVVKLAILVCCDHELKRKILYTNCDLKSEDQELFRHEEKRIWNEKIEKITRIILRQFRLPETLQEKVISAVFAIGIRMVIWAEYHEGTLGISREFSMHFLNSSLFTPQGIIDNKKIAEELMNVKCLAIHQKYKIACLYCFADNIPGLFWQMSRDDMKELTSIRQPGLVRFWSRYLKGELRNINVNIRDQYMLKKAIEDGSKAAVEYCLTILKRNEFNIVYAALEAVRKGVKAQGDDWIIFNPLKKDSWVPTDYYVDIVFFLLSKMRGYEQLDFLQKDIEKIKYGKEPLQDHHRLLEYLLRWPYQDNFMKMANLMWDFLPERKYGVLLMKICNLIEPRIWKNVNYGEEKLYDYRRLLIKFWYQSPERFKRYVFSKQEKQKFIGVDLLEKLLLFENFTNADAKIIELILASALDKDKKNMFASIEWTCHQLLSKEKWRTLDLLAVNCLSTKEEAHKFKRKFICSEEARVDCIDFVLSNKWNSIESAIKWSCLPEEEIDKLKKEMINSSYGRCMCVNLIADHDYETVNNFVMWCFLSEEEAKAFKKDIAYTLRLTTFCAKLVVNEASEAVHKFINFFFSSEEEIKEFRKYVANRVGGYLCGSLISQYRCGTVLDEQEIKKLGQKINFHGGKWEEVEKLLTWCFSSEKEIYEFKKEKIKVLRYIHHDLIKASQFEEAEVYFAWLELSAEEIREVKKDDFFNTYMKDLAFWELFDSYDDGTFNYFYDFGNYQEAVELLLRWYLTDRETVLEFSVEFKRKYLEGKSADEAKIKYAFKKLDLVVAQRLSDLDEEIIGMKRKSENSSSRKKLCN